MSVAAQSMLNSRGRKTKKVKKKVKKRKNNGWAEGTLRDTQKDDRKLFNPVKLLI